LIAEPDRWLVRIGAYRGFALEPESAALALQLLLDSAHELPQQLLVHSAQPIEILLPQLPELLRGSIEVLEQAQPIVADDVPIIDFLQGAFARMLPWRRWWSQWRPAAIVFAVAIAVHLLVGGVQHYRLNKQNLALRQQIEAVYRTVEPRGVVNDPELQLRRKVQALQSHQGSGVLSLLQQVGGALKTIDGVSVQNLTFSEHQGELRVSLSASTFKDVETARAAIAKAGLNAQLVGSNTDGDKTRAQLRIIESK
jgi:type II secretion system protein L